MIRNYLKIAFRNLRNNKLYSLLNIVGLASGMAVALLIGIWVYDEISYNTYNKNYEHIALIQKNRSYNGTINTETSNAIPLAAKLRENYGNYFDEVVISSYGGERVLKFKDKSIVKRGYFMEKGGQEILDLNILKGAVNFPLDPTSILISESVSKNLFGDGDPLEKIIRIDNKIDLKIAGVYENLPPSSTFRSVAFYASFEAFSRMEPWVEESRKAWNENSFPIYVKVAPNVNMDLVSDKIKNAIYEVTKDESKPQIFLQAMSKWHFYPEFKNGVNIASGLQNLWIFGIIGVFVLLLAAINFMNLNTARSEKRAKEIGVRKAIGSGRNQLVKQFYIETALMVFLAGMISIIVAQICLPYFNLIAEKQLKIQWLNPLFWVPFFGFILLTILIAGIYPSLYLSSFNPISVLKGTRTPGKKEGYFRKSLVVFQFSISVILIICTIIIYQQIQFSKNRPLGYEAKGLIQIRKNNPNLVGHFYAMRQDLLNSGAVVEMAEANGPISEFWFSSTGFKWKGKATNLTEDFITLRVTPEFGKAVSWKIKQGRDFSRTFSLDSTAIILNEAALKLMGFKDPINEIIQYEGKSYKVIGVSENIVMESPYEPVKPTIFTMLKANMPFITIKLKPELSVSESLKKVETVLRKYDPEGTFNYKFADTEFGLKFWREERIANLAVVFAAMAVFISLLGVFGLASFIAEQRTKEIGIRKVLGASVNNLWQLLSKEFVVLVTISCLIAIPLAHFYMKNWLQNYEYRTQMSWWIFALSGFGTLLIALLTVSYQALKAALMNPVKSLKTE